MAKDKKKKTTTKKASAAATGKVGKSARRLKTIAGNALVADVVAAALVATAAAIRDSKKARQLAEQAGDEIETLAKQGAERGNAMWQLALDVGRKAMDSISGDDRKPARRMKAAKPASPAGAKAAKPARSKGKTKRKSGRNDSH